jgi:hypothetical protein
MGIIDSLRQHTPVAGDSEIVASGTDEEFEVVITEAYELERAGLIQLKVVTSNLVRFKRLR